MVLVSEESPSRNTRTDRTAEVEAFIQRNYQFILRLLRAVANDRGDVEDLAQDVLLTLVKTFQTRGQTRIENEGGWVRRVVLNEATRYLQRRAKERQRLTPLSAVEDLELAGQNPDDQPEQSLISRESLEPILGALPLNERLLVLYKLAGIPDTTVAAVESWSAGYVGKIRRQARKRMMHLRGECDSSCRFCADAAPAIEWGGTVADQGPYRSRDRLEANGNKHMIRLARSIAEAPPDSMGGPILIWGRAGTGKTNLLLAIVERAKELQRSALYVSAHQINDEPTNAPFRLLNDLTRSSYPPRLLAIDDIDLLPHRIDLQSKLFKLLDLFRGAGTCILLASRKEPNHMRSQSSLFDSHLNWGMTVALEAPDDHAALSVLKCSADEDGPGGTQSADFLLNRCGLSRSIASRNVLNDQPRSESLFRHVSQECHMRAEFAQGWDIDPEALVAAVGDNFGLCVSQLRGQTRAGTVTNARHLAMYLLRRNTRLTLKEIANLLGRSDPSTVAHAVSKVSRVAGNDPEFAARLATIRARCERHGIAGNS